MLENDQKYWVVTASADHAARGQSLGIVQACHGKVGPLRRMRPGDGVVIYSPRQAMTGGAAVQAFTALGHVAGPEVWQVEMAPGFCPWRRSVDWGPARPAPIRPLLPELDLTRGEAAWGMVFRFGLRALTAGDFARIAAAMGADSVGAVDTAGRLRQSVG